MPSAAPPSPGLSHGAPRLGEEIHNAANVRNGWSRFTLDHDRLGSPALVVRLTASCDTARAVPTPSDQPRTQTFERTEPGRSTQTSYTVFTGGCVTTRLSTSNSDTTLIEEAISAIGLTTRSALQQELDQRSNQRLHLDPDT